MSRADEIAQGLREESGCLTFPLEVLDYAQGHADFKAGTPPPRLSSPSYDLGRNRAREAKEHEMDFMAKFEAEQEASHQRVRALLKDRPDLLAEYDASIAEIHRKR